MHHNLTNYAAKFQAADIGDLNILPLDFKFAIEFTHL